MCSSSERVGRNLGGITREKTVVAIFHHCDLCAYEALLRAKRNTTEGITLKGTNNDAELLWDRRRVASKQGLAAACYQYDSCQKKRSSH